MAGVSPGSAVTWDVTVSGYDPTASSGSTMRPQSPHLPRAHLLPEVTYASQAGAEDERVGVGLDV